MAEPKKTPGIEIVEQVLPLVLEIIPGQAADGLIDIYEPGSHEGQTLRKRCERTLNKKDWTIEELQILEDILRQLEGGRLICRGKPIEGTALDHAARQAPEAGEEHQDVALPLIQPQDGGGR